MKSKEVQYVAQGIFQSAKTTVDGGLRVSFDIAGTESEFLAKLLENKDKLLMLVVIPKERE